MNQSQKKTLAEVYKALSTIDVDDHIGVLTDLAGDLQSAFDDKPEKWQDGEKGQAAQEEIDKIEAAQQAVETLKDALDDAINTLADFA